MHQNSGLYNTMLNRLFRPVEYDQREYIQKILYDYGALAKD